MINWNLFREMDGLRSEMDALFNGLLQENNEPGAFMPGIGTRRYPRINLNEDQNGYYLRALLPALDASALEITLTGNTLTLSGERQPENPENARWQRQERGHGKFMRAIELPLEVDADKISAEYVNGVLLVTLPKSEAVKPKQISVKVN